MYKRKRLDIWAGFACPRNDRGTGGIIGVQVYLAELGQICIPFESGPSFVRCVLQHRRTAQVTAQVHKRFRTGPPHRSPHSFGEAILNIQYSRLGAVFLKAIQSQARANCFCARAEKKKTFPIIRRASGRTHAV